MKINPTKFNVPENDAESLSEPEISSQRVIMCRPVVVPFFFALGNYYQEGRSQYLKVCAESALTSLPIDEG